MGKVGDGISGEGKYQSYLTLLRWGFNSVNGVLI